MLLACACAGGGGDGTARVGANSPLHVKMAAFANGGSSPAQSEVDKWQNIVGRLTRKCGREAPERIADMLVAGQELVNEKVQAGTTKGGLRLTTRIVFLDFVRLVDQSLPPQPELLFGDVLTCKSMTAAVATRLFTGEEQVIVDANVGY